MKIFAKNNRDNPLAGITLPLWTDTYKYLEVNTGHWA